MPVGALKHSDAHLGLGCIAVPHHMSSVRESIFYCYP